MRPTVRRSHPGASTVQERTIVARYAAGESTHQLARAFGVSPSAICNVLYGRGWDVVGAPRDSGPPGAAAGRVRGIVDADTPPFPGAIPVSSCGTTEGKGLMNEALWRTQARPSPGPDAVVVGTWTPATVADLTVQRLHLADILHDSAGRPGPGTDALERLLLAFEELVSNGLRHGRAPVQATVTAFDRCWLLEVSDAASELPPTPATGRTTEGGLGLRLVARISSAHGWHTDGRRKTVWGLIEHTADGREPSDPGSRGVAELLADAVRDVSDALGFTPATRFVGPVGDLLGDMTADLLAVIRESLTNVARHARARSAAVDVEVTTETVTARITDDGIGMAGAPRDGGLADLRRRAAWHGGTLTVRPGPSGGTRLVWAVPYGPTARQPN